MARLGREQLTALALRTVEEAATEALHAPVQRTSWIALALAWLLHFANRSGVRRSPARVF